MALDPNIISRIGQGFDPYGKYLQGQQAAQQNRIGQLREQRLLKESEQLDRQEQRRNRLSELLPQVAQGDQAAITEAVGIDPSATSEVRAVMESMKAADQKKLADLALKGGKILQSYAMTPNANWQTTAKKLKELGIDDVPDQPDQTWINQEMAEAGVWLDTYKALNPGKARGGGSEPADLQLARVYAKERGGNISDWIDHVKSGKFSPERLAMDYAKAAMKEQADAYITPEDEGYQSLEDLYKEALPLFQREKSDKPKAPSGGLNPEMEALKEQIATDPRVGRQIMQEAAETAQANPGALEEINKRLKALGLSPLPK